MQDLIRQLLADLGEDPSREGLKDTPKRVEKAYKFLTSGYNADIDQVHDVRARAGRLEAARRAARVAQALERRLGAAARARQDRQDGWIHAVVVAETASRIVDRCRGMREPARLDSCAERRWRAGGPAWRSD